MEGALLSDTPTCDFYPSIHLFIYFHPSLGILSNSFALNVKHSAPSSGVPRGEGYGAMKE